MRGLYETLSAEKQLHRVPRQLPPQRIADQHRIQRSRRGTAGERNAERAFRLRRGLRRSYELFRSPLGDGRCVLQDAHFGVCAIVAHAMPATYTSMRMFRSTSMPIT